MFWHGVVLKKAVSVLCALLLMATVSTAATRHASNKKTSGSKTVMKSKASVRTVSKSSKSKSKRNTARSRSRRRGQQAITSDRTREIQKALIRARYLDGEPSGVWDDSTKRALTRYQNDNGWQTKIVPDSRALIKLGLGPSHDGLLNPDSAALGNPHELGLEREIPGGAAIGGVVSPQK